MYNTQYLKLRTFVLVLLTCGIWVSQGNLTLADNRAEQEVQASVDALWEAARNRDTENSFGNSLPNDDGFYVMDGKILWTRGDTLALYRETFGAAAKNHIEMSDERVTMLTDDLALYVGEGSYDMADSSGASMGRGPMALTLLLKRVNGRWLLLHVHQSFPADE